MTIDNAKDFLSYEIGEGILDLEIVDKLSDKQLIELAEKEMARGDFYANESEEI